MKFFHFGIYESGGPSILAAFSLRLGRFFGSRGPGGDWISFSPLAGKAFCVCGTCTIMVEQRISFIFGVGIAFSSFLLRGEQIVKPGDE